MRGGSANRVEALSGRGIAADEVIPGRFADLSGSEFSRRSKIGVRPTTTVIGDRMRARVAMPRRRGAMARERSAVCAAARDDVRFGDPMFCPLGFGAMRLAGLVACGLFRRFGDRASGGHQKREGNPDRSAQMHPAQSPSCWASPRRGNTIAWPCQWYWMAGGKQIGVVPDCCRCIRVGQGGTLQAKQAKTPMSIPTDLVPPIAVFPTLIGSARRREATPSALLADRLSIIMRCFFYCKTSLILNVPKRNRRGLKLQFRRFVNELWRAV